MTPTPSLTLMFTALRLVRRLLTAVLLSAAISVAPVVFPSLTALLPQAAAASITLEPPKGPPGKYVTIYGSFPACGTATVTFDAAGLGGAVFDPDSKKLDGSFTVPKDAQPGSHQVTVTCQPQGTHASAPFTVTGQSGGGSTPPFAADPTLKLVPDHGAVGDAFDAQGSGFACSPQTVDLSVVDGPSLGSGIPVKQDGSFSYRSTVKEGTEPGTYTLRAACSADASIYADAPFVVEKPTHTANPALALSKEKGAVGDTVQAKGTGFTCPDVRLQWDEEKQLATAAVDSGGTFAAQFTVPDGSEEGARTVRAVCTTPPDQYADAPFTVTPKGGGTDNGGTDNGGTDNGGTDNGGTDNGGTDDGGTDNGGTDDGGTDNGGTDDGGTDNGGTDDGGTDNGGTDNGGTDNGGTDNGGTDNGGTDNGGTDNGGGGGGSGGSATPVGVVVGSTSGLAFALAAAALVYFGRLHRGPRWVHKHVSTALRPATGATELTEDRAPGEPPTHTTRLDPHPDPGRQTLDEEER
ncbi:hypothetical protein [Streptomyces sp. NPDC051921]|uniref:hypothetical protein n=1 Tax=Streptomyces sp. NPDC051921 TaxID=3155806 RepID=UPI003440DECF